MSKNRKNRKRQKNQKYEEFIKFLFARGESDGGVWRWDDELKEPDLTKEEVVEFVHYMFDNYETDLSVYSDSQLGFGLEYIFYNCYSNYCFFLRDGPVSIEKRVKAILSLNISDYYGVLDRLKVSVCGHGAISAVMTAVKKLGAKEGRLLKYATSGDVTGNKSAVVGYSSIIFV